MSNKEELNTPLMNFPKNQNLSALKHFLTNYTWYVVVFFIAIVLILNFPTQKTAKIHSKTTIFDSSKDPTYFVHLTDVHVSATNKKSQKRFKSALDFIKKCNTKTVAITGDLTDNWRIHKIWKEAKQNEKDHELYRSLLNETVTKLTSFVDQSGNHDLFGVFSYDSPNNEFIKTSFFYEKKENLSYENYTVSTYDNPHDDTTFVVINPAVFPSLQPLVDIFVDPTKELLNRVEETLQSVNKSRQIVLMNHYPAYLWFDVRSKYGHTFREMNEIYNINIALSGHTHPIGHMPVHHKENLEVVGVDTKNHHKLAIVSYDNGNTVYSPFDIQDTPKAIITNPVPRDYLSQHDTFNTNDVDVRLLVFSDSKNVSINVFENNTPIGSLEYARTIREGVHLYHLRHNFPDGKHKLRFSGFYNGKIKFFVGDVCPSHREYLGNLYNLFFSATPIFYILLVLFFIILFPVNIESCSQKLTTYVKEKLDWLYTDEWTCQELIPASLLGFFFVRWRVQSIPLYMRIILFLGLFAPFVLPVVVQTIEGHAGVVTTFSVYYKGITRKNVWGDVFKLAFMWFSEAPATFICSMFYNLNTFPKICIIDIVLFAFGCIFLVFFSYWKIAETTKLSFAFLGPLLIIWPLFTVAAIAFWRKTNRSRDTSKYQMNCEAEDETEGNNLLGEEKENNVV